MEAVILDLGLFEQKNKSATEHTEFTENLEYKLFHI